MRDTQLVLRPHARARDSARRVQDAHAIASDYRYRVVMRDTDIWYQVTSLATRCYRPATPGASAARPGGPSPPACRPSPWTSAAPLFAGFVLFGCGAACGVVDVWY